MSCVAVYNDVLAVAPKFLRQRALSLKSVSSHCGPHEIALLFLWSHGICPTMMITTCCICPPRWWCSRTSTSGIFVPGSCWSCPRISEGLIRLSRLTNLSSTVDNTTVGDTFGQLGFWEFTNPTPSLDGVSREWDYLPLWSSQPTGLWQLWSQIHCHEIMTSAAHHPYQSST